MPPKPRRRKSSAPNPYDALLPDQSSASLAIADPTPQTVQSQETTSPALVDESTVSASGATPYAKPYLADEIAQLNHTFKAALVRSADIMRFQATARSMRVNNHMSRVPYSLSSALAREIDRFEDACDTIEAALLRAHVTIADEIERRRTVAQRAAEPEQPTSELMEETMKSEEPVAPAPGSQSPVIPVAGPSQSPERSLPPLVTNQPESQRKGSISSAGIRPSAVHLSALNSDQPAPPSSRPPPLTIDPSTGKFFGLTGDSLASRVTLAQKTSVRGPGQGSPMHENQNMISPELLVALAAAQQHQQGQMTSDPMSHMPMMSPMRISSTLSPTSQQRQMQSQSAQLGMPGLQLMSPARLTSEMRSTPNVEALPLGDQSIDINMDFLDMPADMPTVGTEGNDTIDDLFDGALSADTGGGLSNPAEQADPGSAEAHASDAIAGFLASLGDPAIPGDVSHPSAPPSQDPNLEQHLPVFPPDDENALLASLTEPMPSQLPSIQGNDQGQGAESQPFGIDMDDDLLAALTKPNSPNSQPLPSNMFDLSGPHDSNAAGNEMNDLGNVMNDLGGSDEPLDFSLPDFSGGAGMELSDIDLSNLGFDSNPTVIHHSMMNSVPDDDGMVDLDTNMDLEELLNGFGDYSSYSGVPGEMDDGRM